MPVRFGCGGQVAVPVRWLCRAGGCSAAAPCCNRLTDRLTGPPCHAGTHLPTAAVDNNFWGREQDSPGPPLRPGYIWNMTTMPASDLLGMTSAALAATSLALGASRPVASAYMAQKARLFYGYASTVLGAWAVDSGLAAATRAGAARAACVRRALAPHPPTPPLPLPPTCRQVQ